MKRKVPIPAMILGILLAIAIIILLFGSPEIELPQFSFRDPLFLFALMFILFVLGGALFDRARRG